MTTGVKRTPDGVARVPPDRIGAGRKAGIYMAGGERPDAFLLVARADEESLEADDVLLELPRDQLHRPYEAVGELLYAPARLPSGKE